MNEHDVPPEFGGGTQQGDPVERALATAIEAAAGALARGEAGALETLGALSRELQQRREARVGVVSLDAARAHRKTRQS